jgi:predicted Rossmann fold flavoprotein
MTTSDKHYDVIVVGGGPAGMMAAGTAAARGARVLLLEKNPTLGKKLSITGGGRCNVTNNEADLRTFLNHYGESAKFLFSTFSQFANQDTINFLAKQGLATKVEDRNRVFPVTESAASVTALMVRYLEDTHVTVRTRSEVKSFTQDGQTITGVILSDHSVYTAHNIIIATGGKSRPDTGSTGDGFLWLTELGHTVIAPDPSLVPVAVKEPWIADLAGLTLPEVKLSIYEESKKVLSKTGRLLFTHVGVSGPMVLNLSKTIGELLPYGEVRLVLDLFPKSDHGTLDAELVILFEHHQNKFLRNTLPDILPASLVPVILRLTGIDPDTPCHSVTKENRKLLTTLLKAFSLSVRGLLEVDKAIVTSGGVTLTEVNFKTMQSRIHQNLYLVGDILNIDRPSGGFSLQLCWSTGYVAGTHIPLARTI